MQPVKFAKPQDIQYDAEIARILQAEENMPIQENGQLPNIAKSMLREGPDIINYKFLYVLYSEECNKHEYYCYLAK